MAECSRHAQLTDDQRQIILDGWQDAAVALYQKHAALLADLRELERTYRYGEVFQRRDAIADRLAAILNFYAP